MAKLGAVRPDGNHVIGKAVQKLQVGILHFELQRSIEHARCELEIAFAQRLHPACRDGAGFNRRLGVRPGRYLLLGAECLTPGQKNGTARQQRESTCSGFPDDTFDPQPLFAFQYLSGPYLLGPYLYEP